MRIACEATWCDLNEYGKCLAKEIKLSYDQYEQFWCESNVQFGLTKEQRDKLTLSEMRKVEKQWQEDLK